MSAARMRNQGIKTRILRQGMGVFLALFIPTLIGFSVDSRFDTRPWGTLAALFIGSVAAMVVVVRTTFDFYRSLEAARPPAVPPSLLHSSVKEDENE